MINSFIAKRMWLTTRQVRLSSTIARGVKAGQQDQAFWSTWFNDLKQDNAKDYSVSTMNDLLEVLKTQNTQDDDIYNHVDSYFKANFRKLSSFDAVILLERVCQVKELEEHFWVWETLEETIRPDLDNLSTQQKTNVFIGFGTAKKGSEYLWQVLDDFAMKPHTKPF